MKRNAARICLVIVTNLVVSVFAELIIKPKDAESVVGGSANFNCSTTDPSKEIQWFHYSYPTRENPNMVYGFDEVRGTYRGRFVMKKNILTGEYNLGILNAVAQDAGIYECQDMVGYGNKSQAQLIVLDAKPTCQPDMSTAKVLGKNTCGIEPETFQLSCTATYRGNIAPVLQWRKVGESSPIAVIPAVSDSHVTYNLTLTGGDPAVDGSSYICETTRSSTTEQSSCVSDVIRVFSPQNNYSMVVKKLGDSAQCPTVVENSCSYKWVRTDQNHGQTVVTTGQLVKLDASGLYRCEADCRIRTKPCTLLAMVVSVPEEATVAAPQEGDQSPTFKIPFIIVLILLVIFIILFLVFLLRWRKVRSQSKSPIEVQLLTKEPIIAERPSNVAYSPNPTRIHTIKTQSAEALDKSIKGTAILNNELFIISQLDSEVEVYDCTSLALRRRWQLNDLGDPDDATSCIRNRCIYISDNKTDGKEIFRIDADGNIIHRWSIGEESGRLSVTDQATVILSLFNSSKLVEYSSDGLLIRVLNLSGHGLTHPMHAIRLINGNFVMTQGYLDDPTHKICETTSDGKVIRSFGAEKGPGVAQLMNPTYLAVDRDGSILVADAGNGRVMLIGSNLEFKRELISKRNGLYIPTRICLDDINGRLFVAEYKKDLRSLLVFNIR